MGYRLRKASVYCLCVASTRSHATPKALQSVPAPAVWLKECRKPRIAALSMPERPSTL
jgi:hypothetical protein